MTDITELAQSLKAAAEKATQGNWRAFQYHDGRCGIGGGHNDEIMVCEHISKRRPHDAEFIALANPANILALVEALEKAQAVMNAVVTAAAIRGVRPFDGIDCDPPTLEENAEACGDAMSARIRELEANPPKPHHNGLMQISNELASAKQRIAELESRTVNVKLPTTIEPTAFSPWVAKAFYQFHKDTVKSCFAVFSDACAAAGIKVEVE